MIFKTQAPKYKWHINWYLKLRLQNTNDTLTSNADISGWGEFWEISLDFQQQQVSSSSGRKTSYLMKKCKIKFINTVL